MIHRPSERCEGGWLVLWLVVQALLFRTAAARPHENKSDTAAVEQTTRLVSDARAALAIGDTGTAQRLAAQSYRSSPSPEGLFLLGQIALASSRLLDAQDFMRRYLADPNLDAPLDSDSPREAQRVLDRARPKAAQLNILGDRSTVVSIDERLVGVLPLVRPLLVAPGEHKVLLERHNSRLEEKVRLPVGQLGEVRCNFATKALVLTVLPGVLLLDDSPSLAMAEQAQLVQLVEGAIIARRLSPIGPADAEECSEPNPGACADAQRCEVAAAQRCEADYILRTTTRRDGLPPGTLHVAVELVDVAVGEVAAREQLDCAGCTPPVALAKLKQPIEALLSRGLNRARGQLEIASEPAGAALSIDGHNVGLTPYKAELFAGPHRLEITKEGFAKHTQPVDIIDGQTAQVASTLTVLPPPKPAELPPPPPPPPPRRPLWRLLSGGVAMGAGAVLVGFGASALAVNGNCLDAPLSQPTASCQTIYSTVPTGGALIGVGSALLVGGAVLIAVPQRLRPRRATGP